MDKRLQDLLDKQDITELIHAYCNAADRHDHDKMRALYHEDAMDEGSHIGKPGPEDPSYAFFRLLQRGRPAIKIKTV